MANLLFDFCVCIFFQGLLLFWKGQPPKFQPKTGGLTLSFLVTQAPSLQSCCCHSSNPRASNLTKCFRFWVLHTGWYNCLWIRVMLAMPGFHVLGHTFSITMSSRRSMSMMFLSSITAFLMRSRKWCKQSPMIISSQSMWQDALMRWIWLANGNVFTNLYLNQIWTSSLLSVFSFGWVPMNVICETSTTNSKGIWYTSGKMNNSDWLSICYIVWCASFQSINNIAKGVPVDYLMTDRERFLVYQLDLVYA